MKKISTVGTVILNHGKDRYEFYPKRSYLVSDAVAAHPYLAQYLQSIEDVEEQKKPRKPRKKVAKNDN